ncbi:dipicolinate synthase [Xenorhabdus budapestensis]|uniref:Dipicolinate synthase n=1 Tax=Xenorhabdus budapestensis TaxID=290110 RepID=A0A2D0IPL1_XENBU|nr:dipicolinate synthase [Xenorhabdus budapestensis]
MPAITIPKENLIRLPEVQRRTGRGSTNSLQIINFLSKSRLVLAQSLLLNQKLMTGYHSESLNLAARLCNEKLYIPASSRQCE